MGAILTDSELARGIRPSMTDPAQRSTHMVAVHERVVAAARKFENFEHAQEVASLAKRTHPIGRREET